MLHILFLFIFLITSVNVHASDSYSPVFISSVDAETVAHKIWRNECGGTVKGLTSWNEGEEFASLGICHFIWYPKDYKGPFCEMFPEVLAFFENRGVKLPGCLDEARYCPWTSREEFLANQNSDQMNELRDLLKSTISLQAEFMALRLQKSLPLMVSKFPQEKKAEMVKNFNLLVQSSQGLYAILDYLNFKGEGTSLSEAYQGEGWGLIQVLAQMKQIDNDNVLKSFAEAASEVLERRVKNSPSERNEKRWLKGWQNRINTYNL